ncbi:hypothetical protein BJ742DRAFT_845640, partial [Cladochytrium replicatum]
MKWNDTILLVVLLFWRPDAAAARSYGMQISQSMTTISSQNATMSSNSTSNYPVPSPLPFSVSISLVKPSVRILGVGWGLFTVILLTTVLVVVSACMSQHDAAGWLCTGSIALIAGLIGVLAAVPKVRVGSTEEKPGLVRYFGRALLLNLKILVVVQKQDWTFHTRILFVVSFGLVAVAGLLGAVVIHLLTPVYAIPENLEDDI